MPLNESSLLKKASCFLQNDALIAILIVKGREVVFWKACDELYHVVGSGKTRIRKSTRKKAKKKSGFWFPTLPCVLGQTLKQVFPGLAGNALESSHPDLAGNLRFFSSVSLSVNTGKKTG